MHSQLIILLMVIYFRLVSAVVTTAFNMLKKFIDKGTSAKFEFLSGMPISLLCMMQI